MAGCALPVIPFTGIVRHGVFIKCAHPAGSRILYVMAGGSDGEDSHWVKP